MMTWTWVLPHIVQAIHDEQMAEHGGQAGLRDEGLLESALARPVNRANHGDVGVAELAAAYGFGISQNHPFVDGNKRTAFVVAVLFLALNGYEMNADDTSCVEAMFFLADGTVSENDLAVWLNDTMSSVEG